MATAKALPEYDIDFQAIATRYFQIRQEERDVCDGRQGSGQRRNIPRTMIPVPDFQNVTLNVYNEDWEDRSNILGASSSTFSETTTTLNVEGDSRASGSGVVNTTQDATSLSRVKITRGLCTDIGQTLFLPLPEDPEFLHEALGEELEIDPSLPEDKEEEKTKVKSHFKWRRLSADGATVDVTRSRQHYEGRFSCLVYPSGSIMLQRDSPYISGTNPDMKVVIQKLKNSCDLDDQSLVKNFVLVELPKKRNRTVNVYCWRLEGYYEFQSVPEITYTAPNDYV